MNLLQAAFLGLIQGLTEFLPVSSSAHLVIFQHLLKIEQSLAFDLVVHLATALAVMVYFARDIWELFVGWFLGTLEALRIRHSEQHVLGKHFRLAWLIIIGTIPTGLMGIFFNDFFESLFSSTLAVGAALLLTAGVIWFAEWKSSPKKDEFQIGFLDAILIGFAQGCAIAPGLSRSGTTVSAGLLRGLKRDFAARFSFLMAIPAILGAGVFKAADVMEAGVHGIGVEPLLVGFVVALISGWVAIKIFMQVIQRISLRIFSYYCVAAGILTLLLIR